MAYENEIEQIKEMSVEQMQLYILDKMIMENYAGYGWAEYDPDAWDNYQDDTHNAGTCAGSCDVCYALYEREECCKTTNPFTGQVYGNDEDCPCPCEDCVEERDEE